MGVRDVIGRADLLVSLAARQRRSTGMRMPRRFAEFGLRSFGSRSLRTATCLPTDFNFPLPAPGF